MASAYDNWSDSDSDAEPASKLRRVVTIPSNRKLVWTDDMPASLDGMPSLLMAVHTTKDLETTVDTHPTTSTSRQQPAVWYQKCLRPALTSTVAQKLLQLLQEPRESAASCHHIAQTNLLTIDTMNAVTAASLFVFLDVCHICPLFRDTLLRRYRRHKTTDQAPTQLLNVLDMMSQAHTPWCRHILWPVSNEAAMNVTEFLLACAEIHVAAADAPFFRLPNVWPPLLEEIDAQLVSVLNASGGHAVHLVGCGRRRLPGGMPEDAIATATRGVLAAMKAVLMPCVNNKSFYMLHGVQDQRLARSMECIRRDFLMSESPISLCEAVREAIVDLQQCSQEGNLSQAHWFAREFLCALPQPCVTCDATPVEMELPKFTQTTVRGTKRCKSTMNVAIRPIMSFTSPRAVRLEIRVLVPSFMVQCEMLSSSEHPNITSESAYCRAYGMHCMLLLLQQYRVGYSMQRPPIHIMRILMQLLTALLRPPKN